MRLSAYHMLLKDSYKLPESIDSGSILKSSINPRQLAVDEVLKSAREDKLLFHSELFELLKFDCEHRPGGINDVKSNKT